MYVPVSLPHLPSPMDPIPNHKPPANEPFTQHSQGDHRSLAVSQIYQNEGLPFLSTHFALVAFHTYGGTQRYDLVIEDADGKFWRIQCKSAWIDEGGTVLKFDTANHNVTGTKRDWRHYRGQCEYFAVYSAELNKVYLVPVEDVGTTRAHLRLEPSKNNQEKNVRWAKDYEL